MSVNEHPQQPETTIGIDEKHPDKERHANVGNGEPESESSSYQMAIAGDNHLFAMTDPVLDSKMRLVNATINEIGWTGMHLKLFFLNGFGYAADSLVLALQAVTALPAALEFRPDFRYALNVSAYSGMLLGVLFWGLGADVIGRKFAFNFSLFSCSVFAIVAGASPNWYALSCFVAIASFGAGGNLVLDTTVFLEFLPADKQWLVTLLACWWGVAPMILGAFAWPLLSNDRFVCSDAVTCTRAGNMGWRYIWFANGGLVLICSILRVTIIRLRESPKYLIVKGKDAEVVDTLQGIARQYNRPCSLTLEDLSACGTIQSTYGESQYGFGEFGAHLRGLFATKKMTVSTLLVWLSWALIGLAYPLFYVFLPEYLASRGAQTGQSGAYFRWRNFFLTNSVSIFGPIAAGFLCNVKWLGRKYTMVIGALLTMTFFFAYTAVRTPAQNVGFACAISFCLNIYYGCLYAYTPETMPSAHRATGNGIGVACNRIMGLVSSFVAAYGDTSTSVPIYICAALYIVMAIVAVLLPYEPYGKHSM